MEDLEEIPLLSIDMEILTEEEPVAVVVQDLVLRDVATHLAAGAALDPGVSGGQPVALRPGAGIQENEVGRG